VSAVAAQFGSVQLGWLVVCLAITFIGIAKSGFGGGLGLIVVPITALALPYTGKYTTDDALGLLLPLLLVGDVISVSQNWREVRWPILRRLLPGAFVGMCFGAYLIYLLKSHAAIAAALIDLEIGCESVLMVSMAWYRQLHGRQHWLMPEPARGLITGSFAGTSTTLAHAAGPIIAMYLVPLELGRLGMIGTGQTFFMIANATKLPLYWQAGLFQRMSPLFALTFCPLVIVGALFGRWLSRKMSDKVFVQVIYATTFGLGIFLIAKSAVELLHGS